jgi:hypothetical protein
MQRDIALSIARKNAQIGTFSTFQMQILRYFTTKQHKKMPEQLNTNDIFEASGYALIAAQAIKDLEKIVKRLERAGIEPWLDIDTLRADQTYYKHQYETLSKLHNERQEE